MQEFLYIVSPLYAARETGYPRPRMFTGLIECIGQITQLDRVAGKMRLSVASALPVGELALGDSVAVDGVCLTVTALGAALSFDAAEETLRRSTLGQRRVGDSVQLERAMRATSRFDGHIVQGHVDGVGRLIDKRPDGDAVALRFAVPRALTRYMVEKGGVALDGTSLTLTAVDAESCSVMLVPYSQAKLNLHQKNVGDSVNIEVDVIAKYVEKLVGDGRGAVTWQKLQENGFT